MFRCHCSFSRSLVLLLTALLLVFFFLNDPATPEIYPLSLHDALPISSSPGAWRSGAPPQRPAGWRAGSGSCLPVARSWDLAKPDTAPPRKPSSRSTTRAGGARSEEHTSELQSRSDLVCRLLLEKKKNK